MGYKPGLQPNAGYYAIKLPVFSFEKIRGADINLGPEMKSTGECLGISADYNEALYKAFLGANIRLPKYKNMIITVCDEDKKEILPIAKRFNKFGYTIYSTEGTYNYLTQNGCPAVKVNRIADGENTVLDLILAHQLDLVIDTPKKGQEHHKDGFLIRRNAIETGVTVLTAIDTAEALITSLENREDEKHLNLVDISKLKNDGYKA
jgi:carbamoyl-phosphate synthase large subunit